MDAEGRDQDVEHLIASSPWPEDARSLIDDLGITDERRARAAAMLAGASRSMSKAVRRDPSLLSVLDPPDDFATEKISLVAADDDDPLDGLRRWKRRQLLRIALRDLLGEADLATVGRELSLLADACFARALEIADEGPPLAIIGMGKLGGNELNYASDVDIVFVHDGGTEAAVKRARKVVQALGRESSEGSLLSRPRARYTEWTPTCALTGRLARSACPLMPIGTTLSSGPTPGSVRPTSRPACARATPR